MFAYFIIVCIIIAAAGLIHHVCLFSTQRLTILNILAGLAMSAAYHGGFTAVSVLLGIGFGLIATAFYIPLKNALYQSALK